MPAGYEAPEPARIILWCFFAAALVGPAAAGAVRASQSGSGPCPRMLVVKLFSRACPAPTKTEAQSVLHRNDIETDAIIDDHPVLQGLARLDLRKLLAAQAELAAQRIVQRVDADADYSRPARDLKANHLAHMDPRSQLAVDHHRDITTAATQAEVSGDHHFAGIFQRLLIGQHPLCRDRFDLVRIRLPGRTGGQRQHGSQGNDQAHGSSLAMTRRSSGTAI